MTRRATAPLARILPLVRANADGCWIFTGYLTPQGYGQVWADGKRNAFAHRIVWEQLVGPIPPADTIDHLCRNRACCNPAHLEVVAHAENLRRGNGCAGIASRVTRCPAGHPYDDANTYLRPDGKGRDCNACRAARHHGAVRSPAEARDIRLARGWSAEDVSEATGIPRHTVTRIESGCRTEQTQQYLDALADLLVAAGVVHARPRRKQSA